MKKARRIIHAPSPAAWNMALDQALLDSTAETGIGCLRFYSWEKPTLTLGYFQKTDSRKCHDESLKLPFVRRSTGGGAIIHHHEWTYSIAVPEDQLPGKENIVLYHLVHDSVVEFLNQQGLQAEKYDPQNNLQTPATDSKSFLCFQRRTEGDVVLYTHNRQKPEFGNKILGSAQRKRNGTILQHGSILLRQSEFAPQLPGIEQNGIDIRSMEKSFQEKLTSDLAARLNWEFSKSEISEKEKLLTDGWLQKSFENDSWNQK